jgi:CheY-like chemotaxis protein
VSDDFHDLMRHRVMDILLVSSPYDSFVLEEAGQLSERMLGEFRNLDLHYGPGLTSVATGGEALALAAEHRRFNLIVTTLQVADMNAAELARRAAEAGLGIPVVALAFDNSELTDFLARHDASAVDRVFLWQGDARILVAIVKDVEDRLNVAHDTGAGGVQVILVVEDNVRYYSSLLPTIYGELLHQSQQLISEGLNLSQKILRMRARPKILLCRTFEEAWDAFTAYRDDVLGVVSDVEFPREGRPSRDAGLQLARMIRGPCPDVPVLLHSSRPENEARARETGADFLLKGSPVLLQELRRFMVEYFGFGPFVFRTPEGREVARAENLRGLEEKLRTAPAESIAYHAERNHFSKWLKARTEFRLAHRLRPRTVGEFGGTEALRRHLIEAIADYRRERAQALVADFDRATFAPGEAGRGPGDFHRIGGGSLGGKARGLAFMRRLLAEGGAGRGLVGVRVTVPSAVVVATDVFDRFLDNNHLRDFALRAGDEELRARFDAASFPADARRDLRAFVERVRHPLAVRSSSLLEDSPYQPFTGVYETLMLANDEGAADVRLDRLVRAIKRVYGSMFTRQAKAYVRATPYRLEEEKMAVILQQVVGTRHGSRFYPDLAGVARSHNFYPAPPLTAGDGIAAVALGLGRTVVDGGACLRFSPRHPQRPTGFSSVTEALENSQRTFWALELGGGGLEERQFELEAAEEDGTLAGLASTWSRENDAVYDGTSRDGVRLVTLAPILKHRSFPLAEILDRVLALGEWGMGAPVEIEFAANLSVEGGAPREFGLLQMRPLALSREREELRVGEVPREALVCRSDRVLGNGRLEVRDVVAVDRLRFDRAQTLEAAAGIAQMNAGLVAEGRPYLLVGVGRWGSRDPWLGIPVAWDQIAGARVIVEAGFRDLRVTPSQGTHFFQNLTSFNVGYFTVNPDLGEGFVDWEWLAAQPALREAACVRHLRFEAPVRVTMDGQRGEGVILKP